MNNISFVIPAYNAEKTLAESIDSIFNGNFVKGDEVIIIDDFSSDGTYLVAENLSKKYQPNITVIKNKENRGCPASRNIGIRQANKDLIFNLDSDNILPPNSISILRLTLIEEKADVVSFKDYYYFKLNTKLVTHKWIYKSGLFTLSDLFSGMTNPAPGGNFLYRKSIWNKVGGYWEYGKGLHEAWGFSFKLLVNGAKFYVVPNTFYYHRYFHESLFVRENKKNNESIRITNKFIEDHLDIFIDSSLQNIKSNPDWFNSLEKTPIQLKGQSLGINGKIIFSSKIKQILYSIKKIIK